MDSSVAAERYPDFKRHLRPVVSAGEAAYLFSERGVIALRGPEIASLAALLDGRRSLDHLIRARPAGLDADQVAALLGQLVDADLVTFRSADASTLDERATAFWDACGVDGATASRPDALGRVALVGVGEVAETDRVDQALRQAGIDVVRGAGEVGGADLTLVLCDDYLNPALAEVDAACRAAGRPWLLAKPAGTQVWLGPVFEPGRSGCWHCLAHRLWGHRHAEACVQAELGERGPARRPAPSVPPLASAVSHLITLEATKWLAGVRHEGQHSVWTLDAQTLDGRRHELRARPQCPGCGDPELVAEQVRRPVVLKPAKKASSGGGGHRTMTPLQVLDRYRHLISPVTGIVKEVVRDPNAPPFVNSYLSGPNVSRNVTRMSTLRASLRAGNGGKGATPIDAEVGALCEAVERFSGTYQGDEHRISGSFVSLGEQAIHPNDCAQYDPRQYADRAAWNRTHSVFNHVCDPFDEHAVRDWTPVWSLTEQRQRLLPTALLYYGVPDRQVRADSNGNAAGSSLEDAVLQGLLEVVERDAVALWWYNRTKAPRVDIAAFADPWADELCRHYAQELGREVWVLDVTSDLGVPVMVAVSRRIGVPQERVMFGFGAHLDPRTALRRALTELNQLLPLVLNESFVPEDPETAHWLSYATVANQPYLVPAPGTPIRPADYDHVPRDDVRDDVTALVGTIAEHGMDTLVLDQTRPDIGLPVVKVIVPGMRSFWARLGPGRLFDVPVALGRVERPTEYHELNPLPLFL